MANTEYPVLFVGAGPGDPELITLKGKRALEEADLVLYAGSLVNEALLDYCSPGCVTADSSPLSLEEQMALVAEHGITRHALIVVGECVASHGARSLLYSPHFAHGARDAAPEQSDEERTLASSEGFCEAPR